MRAMDPRRLVPYYLVMTLFLLALAAGAYTSLREVSEEADAIRRQLHWTTLVDFVHDDLLLLAEVPPEARPSVAGRRADSLRSHLEALRGAAAGTPLRVKADNLSEMVERVLREPADPVPLGEAVPAASILRKDIVAAAREQVFQRTDRPAAERARWILYGSAAAAFLGSAAFTFLFLRAVRDRRAAEERVRRSEALAGLGALAAGVAHEVNNPVATIAACAEAAAGKLRATPPDAARAADLLRTISSEAARCAGIVQGLMDLGRDGKPAVSPVDLPALVRDTAELARLHPRMKRVPIRVEAAPGVPMLLADAARLKQAVLNLLANAAEVSPEGASVEVSVRADGDGAEVEVRDHGPGVPASERRAIFEPFRTGRTGGTGIGLSVVDRVVASHGGTVEVDDAPGGGARFRLRLPLRPTVR